MKPKQPASVDRSRLGWRREVPDLTFGRGLSRRALGLNFPEETQSHAMNQKLSSPSSSGSIAIVKHALTRALVAGVVVAFHLARAQSWVQTSAPSQSWTALASSADGTKLVAVANDPPAGEVYLSTDYGVTWTPADVPSGAWSCVASSADGTQLVIAGYDSPTGPVYLSSDSGATWTPAGIPGHGWKGVASSADGSNFAAAVYGGGIFVRAKRAPQSGSVGTVAHWRFENGTANTAASGDGTILDSSGHLSRTDCFSRGRPDRFGSLCFNRVAKR
jgi:hypothetical protein